MLPRLQAEERLNAIVDGGVAAGTVERREQTDLLRALRNDAAMEAARPARANAAVLGTMGIAIRGPLAASEEPLSDG